MKRQVLSLSKDKIVYVKIPGRPVVECIILMLREYTGASFLPELPSASIEAQEAVGVID